MSNETDPRPETGHPPALAKPIRSLQIICGAMILACGGSLLGSLPGLDFGNLQTELKLLVLLATVSSLAFLFVSRLLFGIIVENTTARAGKGSQEQRGFAVVRGAWLIRFVLFAAVFFLNLIVGLLENNLIPLLIAALAVLLMLVSFPVKGKVENVLTKHLTSR